MNPSLERPCFLFCGGGTGGHLTPGLSVAEEIKRRLPEARLVFAGTGRFGEREWVLRHGFDFVQSSSAPWGLGPVRAPRFFARNAAGFLASLVGQARLAPRAVIGLGGYGSLAPGVAAVAMMRPLVLLEQNAVPGKANRVLSRWAREVYCAWEESASGLRRPERAIATGNPIRRALRERETTGAAERFGLDPEKQTLFVMGGSQGAAAVNRSVVGALEGLRGCADWLQVLHATGQPTFEEVRAAYQTSGIRHCVTPFIQDMASAYAVADLVLCRAGGTSLAEITDAGLPSVLIPLPIAAHDHQSANARLVEQAGAAVAVGQDALTPEGTAGLVREILGDSERLEAMSAASRRVGRPEAAETVAERLLALAEAEARDAEHDRRAA